MIVAFDSKAIEGWVKVLVGVIGIGMLLGLVAGGGALYAGLPIWTAVLFYAATGTLFVLLTLLAGSVVFFVRNRPPREQHSYQK